MGVRYLMRAYDPAGETHEEWLSDQYDSAGSDYSGIPVFGTLVNVHAVLRILVPEAAGVTNGGLQVRNGHRNDADPAVSPGFGGQAANGAVVATGITYAPSVNLPTELEKIQ